MISAAYSAEIVRAGIEAIPVGQFEAARALGLHFYSTMRKVILPQAIKHRGAAADVERHQRHEGHGAGLGGRDA